MAISNWRRASFIGEVDYSIKKVNRLSTVIENKLKQQEQEEIHRNSRDFLLEEWGGMRKISELIKGQRVDKEDLKQQMHDQI